MTKVATVILNWNGKQDLLECLASVLRAEHEDWEHQVVVVDNASTDGSAAAVAERFPEVVLVQNPENLGFAEGNNRGIAWAREQGMDYVILLNNDTAVEPDAFSLLLAEARRRPRAGAVMPLIRYYGRDEVWYAGGSWIEPFGRMQALAAPLSPEPYRTQLFTACCVLLPMRVLDAVGMFDPRFFIYFEDVELALRMEAAGYETWVTPQAVLYHKVASSNGGPISPFALYYQVRNNLLLIRDRSGRGARRSLGYLYMAALSGKICMNLLARRVPRKAAAASSVGRAWVDFFQARWGARA